MLYGKAADPRFPSEVAEPNLVSDSGLFLYLELTLLNAGASWRVKVGMFWGQISASGGWGFAVNGTAFCPRGKILGHGWSSVRVNPTCPEW